VDDSFSKSWRNKSLEEEEVEKEAICDLSLTECGITLEIGERGRKDEALEAKERVVKWKRSIFGIINNDRKKGVEDRELEVEGCE